MAGVMTQLLVEMRELGDDSLALTYLPGEAVNMLQKLSPGGMALDAGAGLPAGSPAPALGPGTDGAEAENPEKSQPPG